MTTQEIFIEGLDLPVRIGVPDAEREHWQVLRANVSLRARQPFEAMQDDVAKTIDYERAANAIRDLAAVRPRKLIETLASEIADLLIKDYHAAWVRVELRKRILPGTDCVGVRLERSAPNA